MFGYWNIKALNILWIKTIIHSRPTILNGIRHHASHHTQHLRPYNFSLAWDDGLHEAK